MSLFRCSVSASVLERLQAERFVGVFDEGEQQLGAHSQPGRATVGELEALVGRFLGRVRAEEAFTAVLTNNARVHLTDIEERRQAIAAPPLVERSERLLAGAIGAASARVMISSVAGGTAPSIEGVLEILEESSKVLSHSRRLERQSRELEAASRELRIAMSACKSWIDSRTSSSRP